MRRTNHHTSPEIWMAKKTTGNALLFIIALSVIFGGCGAKVESPAAIEAGTDGSQSPGRSISDVRFVDDDSKEGMTLVLRESKPPIGDGGDLLPIAKGEPLSKQKTQQLLSRVDKLKDQQKDRKDFALRADSMPPPRTGDTVDISFPPLLEKPVPSTDKPGELNVLRFAPEGEVSMAPHMSITFSKPMVAVTKQTEASKTTPAKIHPLPEGQWRWLGTRTLLYKPSVRFPMATNYTVTIPAGTASTNGDKLSKEQTFSFKTPPLAMTSSYPRGNSKPQNPLIFIEFNQKIRPAELLNHISLRADDKIKKIRLATEIEMAEDDYASSKIRGAEKDRWIALVPEKKLPLATDFTVVLKKGAPSAEGPKTTKHEQSFSFRTYDPLTIKRKRCSGARSECPPSATWQIDFNNILDTEAFDPTAIAVEPSFPGMDINMWGHTISITGFKKGRTKYTVTIPASIKDHFKQTLGKDESITFEVGPATKSLFGPRKKLVTLDPSGPAALAIHSINHSKLKISINGVKPKDWPAWIEWQNNYRYETTKPGPMPGEQLKTGNIKVDGEKDALTQTFIDFEPYLKDGYGQFVVRIEPSVKSKERRRRQEILLWVQVTDLALTAFVDDTDMLAWTTALKDGKSVKDATLSLIPEGGKSGKSDKVGLAKIPLKTWEDARVLVAQSGADTVILPEGDPRWGGGGWANTNRDKELRWFTFDDRGIYRPGESVHVKGWIRQNDPSLGGDISALRDRPSKIKWVLSDSRGNELKKGTSTLSKLSGFDLEIKIPKNINLGFAKLELRAVKATLGNDRYVHRFKIEEFRRPEFEVTTEVEDGPYLLGEEIVATAKAAYYAGGGLSNAKVNWQAHAEPADYIPPNRSEYHFGIWNPWWGSFKRGSGGDREHLEGKTDALGEHHLAIHFKSLTPVRPMTVTAQATVEDVNRQAWSASKKMLIHPSAVYVGLKTKKNYYDAGDEIAIKAAVFDVDGRVAPKIEASLRMVRLSSTWEKGRRVEKELDPVDCTITSAKDPSTCKFTPKVGGRYRIKAIVKDSLGRSNETEIRLWVQGGDTPPARNVDQEKLTLVPEKKEYQPGETARFLLESPFFPAEGILTIRRSGLVSKERFSLSSSTKEFLIPIVEKYIPNFTVQIDLVGSANRMDDSGKIIEGAPKRPAYAKGSLKINVPPLLRTLNVSATPTQNVLEPGGKTTIDLTVKDSTGAPVKGAELAVWVADESVLALSGYQLPDPISVFYKARGAGVRDYHSRQQVILSDPNKLNLSNADNAELSDQEQRSIPFSIPSPSPTKFISRMSSSMGSPKMIKSSVEPLGMLMGEQATAMGAGDDTAGLSKIGMRSDFNAIALFTPKVNTDNKGHASVKVNLPDSLTRYRIMVVAVAGGRKFGTAESNITAQLPLMIRPSAPRFLNFGDRFELPVILQNQTNNSMNVDVAVRATNISLAQTFAAVKPSVGDGSPESLGWSVTIPPNDRVEVRFPAAAQMAGEARFQVVASSGAGSDAAEFSLPVWTPATSEAFATYGEIDQGAIVQPISTPDDVWSQFGGLEVTTSSTQLQALTDAVLYLTTYRFDCNEQIASRLMAIAGLRDVLSAFEAEGMPSAEDMEASIKSDLKRLAARQNHNGGFSFWRKGNKDWPYLTVHVANALARAAGKKYNVPKNMWSKAERYLKQIERHIPSWYSDESKWSIRAYALNVLHLMGKSDGKKTLALLKEAKIKRLSIEALGWMLPVLNAHGAKKETSTILKYLGNNVAETAAGAHFVTGYKDGAHVLLHSSRRVDGVVLESLIEVDQESSLIPKLVRGLLGHRVRGKWSNTQENAFILLAMDQYFNTYEKVKPNFVARVWLGEGFAGEHKFKGRTTERALINIPMSRLAKKKKQNLVLQKTGEGRLYYRVGMRYAPKDLDMAAADYGFAIERTYEHMDNPNDVRRDKDGAWHIKAGARIRVRLTMVNPMRRYHVALVDPMPAGIEPINPTLAVTGEIPADPNSSAGGGNYWWWNRPWYEHQNMRDDRVEAFASILFDGVHNYSYVAKATTPGEFVVPPAKAEEMYHPETFGRTASDKVIVE